MVRFIIFSGALIFFFACSGGKQAESNLVFDKLIGTWKLGEEDQFEQWSKKEDGSYSSRTFAEQELTPM